MHCYKKYCARLELGVDGLTNGDNQLPYFVKPTISMYAVQALFAELKH